jgi:hypothetical protein
MGAQRGNGFSDLRDCTFDSLGNSGTRAFGFLTHFPIPSAESDGRGELLRKGIHLTSSSLGASEVVKPLGLFQVSAELIETSLVFRLSRCIQNRTSIRQESVLPKITGVPACCEAKPCFDNLPTQLAYVELASRMP